MCWSGAGAGGAAGAGAVAAAAAYVSLVYLVSLDFETLCNEVYRLAFSWKR